MKQLLIGTGNRGKARFIKNLLSDLQVKFLSPQELGVSISVDENGDTVEENARIKALGYFRASGVATLSPDSGICIEVCQMISNPAFMSGEYPETVARPMKKPKSKAHLSIEWP